MYHSLGKEKNHEEVMETKLVSAQVIIIHNLKHKSSFAKSDVDVNTPENS